MGFLQEGESRDTLWGTDIICRMGQSITSRECNQKKTNRTPFSARMDITDLHMGHGKLYTEARVLSYDSEEARMSC